MSELIVSDREPECPEPGQRWKDTRDGRTYLRYQGFRSERPIWVEEPPRMDLFCSLETEVAIRRDLPSAASIAALVSREQSARQRTAGLASGETRQGVVEAWHAYVDPIAEDWRKDIPEMPCRKIAQRIKLQAKDELRTVTDPTVREVLRKIETLSLRTIADRVCEVLSDSRPD
jgi:hypothetical protein